MMCLFNVVRYGLSNNLCCFGDTYADRRRQLQTNKSPLSRFTNELKTVQSTKGAEVLRGDWEKGGEEGWFPHCFNDFMETLSRHHY